MLLYPNPGTKTIKKLFKTCVELIELNFSDSLAYESKFLFAIAHNLTPKIKKVDLSRNESLKDRHVKILVQRCNQISELDLSFASITNDCVDSIATHLNSSLEKLDVSYTEIDSAALLQLRSVRTLKILHCLKGNHSKGLRRQEKYIRKKFPRVSINKEEHWLFIAKSTTNLQNIDSGSAIPAVEYEDGFWEIKAKAQKSFQK